MPRYYKATVTVPLTFEGDVAGETEEAAVKQAMELDEQGAHPSSIAATRVALACEGESHVEVGTRVRHFVFGTGVLRRSPGTRVPPANFSFAARSGSMTVR